jgi:HlyD family secretion protein
MSTLELPRTNAFSAAVRSFTLPSKTKRPPLLVLAALVVALALVAATLALVRVGSAAAVSYVSTPVVRQDLVQSVSATGTVNPQNTIAVGTQESGTISEIDADFNSHVKKGQILAKLDPTTLQAALDQANAALAQAQAQADAAEATAAGAGASVGTAAATQRAAQATAQAALATARSGAAGIASAQSNVTKSQSALALAQQTVARDEALLAQGFIAQSQLDSDRSNLVAAQTTLQAAQAAVQQAQLAAQAAGAQAAATVDQTSAQAYSTETAQSQAQTQVANAAAAEANVEAARAQVQTAESNLEKTVITSPVDGTVVSRGVSVGETVAASLQTPTLFSIAQDLDKMEVDLAVGEPDIGNVKPGDSVDLSVLAYPNRTYAGTVSQVRIDPATTNNVVTYTTVVLVDNRDGSLLPGMTANAQIHVAKAQNALVVPAAALAYRPSATGTQHATHRATASAKTPSGSLAANANGSSPWGATTSSAAALPAAGAQSRIFVERAGKLEFVPVKIDLVSGAQAAVTPLRGTLAAGDAVVTADSGASSGSASGYHASAASNPLAGGTAGGGAMRGIH